MTNRLARKVSIILMAVLSSVPAPSALAHVVLDQKEAPIRAPYRLVLRVPHGCGGSATVRLEVHIPEGIIAVKPMAKPGWQIDIQRGAYEKSYLSTHGARLTDGVKEVVWSGGRLPNDLFDEFVLSAFISGDLKPGTIVYFPVIQKCEKATDRWTETPSQNNAGEPLNEPAPSLTLLPAKKK
jgi:uncharacterized protein YcnI